MAFKLFLVARIAGINRYCKSALRNVKSGPVILSSKLVSDVRELVGFPKGAKIPLFGNVPYIRRFRVNGRVLITSFVFPPSHFPARSFILMR